MKKIIPIIIIVLIIGWGCSITACSNNIQDEQKEDSSFYDQLSLKRIMKMDSVEKRRFYLALNDSLPDLWDKRNVDETMLAIDDEIPSFSADQIIFLHYRQKVHGYRVKIIFKRYDCNEEIGRAVLYFSKPGHTFFVDCLTFSDKGLNLDKLNKVKPGETVYLKYIRPKKGEYLSENSPFYFKDMDFDGEKELVVNNIGMGQNGYYNTYDVYKVFGEKPLRLIGLPFKDGSYKITNYNVEYEPHTQCILDKRYDGYYAYGHFRYKSVPSNGKKGLKRVFQLVDAEDMGYFPLNNKKASDSINLLQPYKKYERIDGKLVLIERGVYESGNYGWFNSEAVLERNEKGLKCDSTEAHVDNILLNCLMVGNLPLGLYGAFVANDQKKKKADQY